MAEEEMKVLQDTAKVDVKDGGGKDNGKPPLPPEGAAKRPSEGPLYDDDKGKPGMPRKRFYRARAHSNPLSDSNFPVPLCPAECNWSEHFPSFFPTAATGVQESSGGGAESAGEGDDVAGISNAESAATNPLASKVRFADIGCGFGGLLVRLSPLFPDTLMVGMELRDKVSEYVKQRIDGLRMNHPGQYGNITVLRTNAMKYLPNYFEKGQLTKMFFLFPDPHFKEKNHRRRIITQALLAEYAYIMAVGGILYTITDVEELHQWMASNIDAHPLFRRLTETELADDVAAGLLISATEEGQKVERNQGKTFKAVYRRVRMNAGA
eukprot:TRINITY_DN22243_c0_g1_i1.p1 TRINITY_DN22243_c0_g1~~TRINITY_DN22243_c0_g1_i1.p1  ORF type:complete len:323 (-),score=70.12 TRINITY_DN22243_c0_g1_i1:47-1015(-)